MCLFSILLSIMNRHQKCFKTKQCQFNASKFLFLNAQCSKGPDQVQKVGIHIFELVEASCQNGKQIQHKSSISLTQSICQYSYMDVKRVFTFLDVEERAGICVVMGFYIIQFGENDWLTGFFKPCCYTPTLLTKSH